MRRARPALASAALASLATFAAFVAPACSSAHREEARPTASLAQSGQAAQSVAWLRRRWASATREERIELEPYVRSLRALHGHEPVVVVAELYLAWLALEKGDSARALSIASTLERAGPGATLDVARTLRGAALVQAGRPAEALPWLEPLRGKLLDLDARALYYEATGRAFVETRRWREAIDLFDAWLRDGSDDTRPELAARVEIALASVPGPELERALLEMRARAAEGVPAHAELTRRLVTKRLATMALERGDAPLARRLLAQRESFGDLGEASAGVAELAGLDAPSPRVQGRALGLLMPRAREASGRRALAFSQGLLDALRAPSGQAPRVATRSLDEPGADPPSSLHALLAEGAGLLVGGFDPEGARQIAEFAEREGVVALLATPPSSWPPGARWTFVVGVDEGAADALVAKALGERADGPLLAVGMSTAVARAASPTRNLPCPDDAAARHAFAERLLEGVRQSASARAIMLGGDEPCARQALVPLGRGRRLALGLGLEASALLAAAREGEGQRSSPLSAVTVFLRVGCYPADERGSPSPPLLALSARGGRAPSWWALLGHETADLAAQALAPLPLDSSREAAGVQFRRALVLAGARSARPLPCLGPPPGPGPQGNRLEPRVSFLGRGEGPSLRPSERPL
ncbi:MAG: hypothetical protein MUF34_18045 [Polyangiaceae bacterium]|nr:hypothetical protein [Polyangiaceae bacterium]